MSYAVLQMAVLSRYLIDRVWVVILALWQDVRFIACGRKAELLMPNGFEILIVSKSKTGTRHQSTYYVSWNSGGEKPIVLPITIVSLYVVFIILRMLIFCGIQSIV